jgi:hypothetical protein
MPLFFEGFMEFKGGGGLITFLRGGPKNDFAGKGGLSSEPPPLFTLSVIPALPKNSIFRRARDGLF